MYQNQYTDHVGGLMMYVREDLPGEMRDDLVRYVCDSARIECIAKEIIIWGQK